MGLVIGVSFVDYERVFKGLIAFSCISSLNCCLAWGFFVTLAQCLKVNNGLVSLRSLIFCYVNHTQSVFGPPHTQKLFGFSVIHSKVLD